MSRLRRPDAVGLSKIAVFLAALAPLGFIVWNTLQDTLGPDPVGQLERHTGDWTLRLLLVTLAMTPLRRLTGWAGWIRYRRMLGLFTFFYATVHLLVYVVIDLGGFWEQVLTEIAKRPYITAGFFAWVAMLPLAATSTRAMMRRLGSRWKRLHRLVYVAAILAVLHFAWQVKYGNTIAQLQPVVYGAVLAALLLLRHPAVARVGGALKRVLRRMGRRARPGRGIAREARPGEFGARVLGRAEPD